MCVLPACTTFAARVHGSGKRVRVPGSGATEACRIRCGCWESGLTAEPLLQIQTTSRDCIIILLTALILYKVVVVCAFNPSTHTQGQVDSRQGYTQKQSQ